MTKPKKKRVFVALAIGATAVGALTIYGLLSFRADLRHSFGASVRAPRDARASSRVKTKRSLATPHSLKPSEETAQDRKDRSASADMARRMVDLAMERKRLQDLRKSNPAAYRTDREEWKQDKRSMESELLELLASSEAARKEYFGIVAAEQDHYLKAELVAATRGLDPSLRQEMALDLSDSSDPASRKLGLETLQVIGTEQALDHIADVARNDTDPDVRRVAVRAIAGFSTERSGRDQNAQTEMIRTLKEFVGSENAREIRETALRGLIAQPFLSPADRDFIEAFARNETDPKLKELASAASRTLSAHR